MSKKKTETIEEYLARGGKITKVPAAEPKKQIEVVKKTTAGEPAIILTLEDASLYYGEQESGRKPKKPKSSGPTIDISKLPPELRNKYIAKLKENFSGEDYEEGFKKIEEVDEED
jgi:hypothetical protein